MAINIASILHEDGANGPGLRCTVFVQGCRHQCKNCHSKHTWPFGTGVSYTPEQLIAECTKNPLEDGITFTGGDPVYQYKELLPVVEQLSAGYRVHSIGPASIVPTKHLILYTGFETIELLDMCNNDSDMKSFIMCFDNIVVGKYREDLKSTTIKFRGSTNQKILVPRVFHKQLLLQDVTSAWDGIPNDNMTFFAHMTAACKA